eukprot:s4764_g1.t1
MHCSWFHFQCLAWSWTCLGGPAVPENADVALVLERMRGSNEFLDEFEKVFGDSDEEAEPENMEEPDDTCIMKEEAAAAARRDGDEAEAFNKEIGEATVKILTAPEAGSEVIEDLGLKAAENRTTLSGALRNRETFEGAEPDLVRLLCFMRMAPFGCDSDVIPDSMVTRKLVLSSPAKWHNLVRHQMAHADALDNLPMHRRSRVSAWIEQQEKARKQAAPSLPSCVVIRSGDVVAVAIAGTWRVGLILTVWRVLKKGAGGQQCCQEIPRSGMHPARVVIMQEDEEHQGLFQCKAESESTVLQCLHIGLRLDTEATKRKAGIDGLKVLLPEDCFIDTVPNPLPGV